MLPWISACLLALVHWLYPGAEIDSLGEQRIAEAIDSAAHEVPLADPLDSVLTTGLDFWEYDNGVVEMAAEMIVLALTEGHLDARAVGVDGFGSSYGAWQIHETTLEYALRKWVPQPQYLLSTPIDIALDARPAGVLAAHLIRESHLVCARRPIDERLAWYASGGPTCDVTEGLTASRRRMRLVRRMLHEHPVYWVDATH